MLVFFLFLSFFWQHLETTLQTIPWNLNKGEGDKSSYFCFSQGKNSGLLISLAISIDSTASQGRKLAIQTEICSCSFNWASPSVFSVLQPGHFLFTNTNFQVKEWWKATQDTDVTLLNVFSTDYTHKPGLPGCPASQPRERDSQVHKDH